MFNEINYTNDIETAKTNSMKQLVSILNDVSKVSKIVKNAWIKGDEKRCIQLNFSEKTNAPISRCELWVCCGKDKRIYVDIYIGMDVINNHETIKEFFCNSVLSEHFIKGNEKERLYRFKDINDFIPTYSTLLVYALCEKHIDVVKTVNAIKTACKATDSDSKTDSKKTDKTATASKTDSKAKTDSKRQTASKDKTTTAKKDKTASKAK